MNIPNSWISALLGKDKQKAKAAAEHILNLPDIQAWQCLIENSDYIFNYIKERAAKYLISAASNENIENIFKLLKYHSSDWDDCIAECFRNNANESINAKISDLLFSGCPEEKAYAARFFYHTNPESVKTALFEAAKEEYQPLKNNAAMALGKINDQTSYNYFIEKLNSDDDWEKVEAAEFLSNFGNENAVISILKAMHTSGMTEYLAGEVAILANIAKLFEEDGEIQILALEAFDNILSGLAEEWSLTALFDFKIYECIEKLLKLTKENTENPLSGKYAQLLLKAKSRISLFMENSQYTFDEDKTVLSELDEIYHLLICESDDFWNKQAQNINKELKSNDIKRKLSAITVINELELKNSLQYLKEVLSDDSESEIVIYEVLLTLSRLGLSGSIDNLNDMISRIKDENLLAIIRNSFSCSNQA